MGIFENFSLDRFAGGLASGIQSGTGIAGRRAAGRRADEQGRLANERLRLQQEQFGFEKDEATRNRQAAENKQHADILSLFAAGEVAKEQGATPAQIAATKVGQPSEQQEALLSLLASQDPTAQTQAQLQQQKLQADILAQMAGSQATLAGIDFKKEGLVRESQAADLAREKFEFDQNKFIADVGRLKNTDLRAYQQDVSKVTQTYDNAAKRISDSRALLKKGDPKSAFLALRSLMRIGSDEALNQGDIDAALSKGLIDSDIAVWGRSLIGQENLTPEQFEAFLGSLDVYEASEADRYDARIADITNALPDNLPQDQRQDVLGRATRTRKLRASQKVSGMTQEQKQARFRELQAKRGR